MNMKMAEVTAAVFIAKKNFLKRSGRMDGSDAGVVRNGHTETALAGLRRLWIVLCVALVKSLIKLILKHNCAYPIVRHDAPGFVPTPGAKAYFARF
jgi:accessory gene regulator protein AgrB